MTGPVLCVMLAWIGWVTFAGIIGRKPGADFDRKDLPPL